MGDLEPVLSIIMTFLHPVSYGASLSDPKLRQISEELIEFGIKLKHAGFLVVN